MDKCCKNPKVNDKENTSKDIKQRIYDSVREFAIIADAEDEAFEKAGMDEGTVTYICPICGCEAVANRYKYKGRYHRLGGCKTCGTCHMM